MSNAHTLLCVFRKCCICTQGVCMHVCLLCVYSKQITLVHAHVHAYMHTHRGKGVALRAVLFIDVLPQRGSACDKPPDSPGFAHISTHSDRPEQLRPSSIFIYFVCSLGSSWPAQICGANF
uniref:Secreted protein n=1 Tax=Astatotilapia calliptera TaxID=8154 RepID=A0AAX7SGI3_ASTCA